HACAPSPQSSLTPSAFHPPPPSFPTRRSSDLFIKNLLHGIQRHLTLPPSRNRPRPARRRAPGCAPGRPAGSSGPSPPPSGRPRPDRKSTRLNSSHVSISYAVFCLKKTTIDPPA